MTWFALKQVHVCVCDVVFQINYCEPLFIKYGSFTSGMKAVAPNETRQHGL